MIRLTTFLLVLVLALAAGCDDDDDDGNSGGGGNGGGSAPAGQLEDAAAAMEENDYDGALQILDGLAGDPEARKRAAEYRKIAARETLANAKKKSLKTEPRPAVSLTRTSLRYHPTPEARAFLPKAERAHAIFHRRQQDDD